MSIIDGLARGAISASHETSAAVASRSTDAVSATMQQQGREALAKTGQDVNETVSKKTFIARVGDHLKTFWNKIRTLFSKKNKTTQANSIHTNTHGDQASFSKALAVSGASVKKELDASLDKMFKQANRTLHPDRFTDPAIKAEADKALRELADAQSKGDSASMLQIVGRWNQRATTLGLDAKHQIQIPETELAKVIDKATKNGVTLHENDFTGATHSPFAQASPNRKMISASQNPEDYTLAR